MLSQARRVTSAENEGLGAIRGPLGFVVEASGIPDNFEHELRDADWVCGGAAAAERKEVGGTSCWIGNVVLMIGGVKILAVPAAIHGVSTILSRTGESKKLTLGIGCWNECHQDMA